MKLKIYSPKTHTFDLKMSSWEDWNKHVLKCRGASGGGIFTHKGAICAQQGTIIGADQILNLNSCYEATSNSIVFGESKFMLLKNENDTLFFRVSCID